MAASFCYCLRLHPLSSDKQENWVANEIHFVIVIHFVIAGSCQKGVELLLYSSVFGWILKTIHTLLANFGWYLVQVFIPYWSFEYTKAVIYTAVKVGGCIGQLRKILQLR